MKTFAQYLEGIFDVKTHQHPMDRVADEFIESLPKEFEQMPKDLLKSYVRHILDGDRQKAMQYRTNIMLAAKSYDLVRILDNLLAKNKNQIARDISWYGDTEHHGKSFGQK